MAKGFHKIQKLRNQTFKWFIILKKLKKELSTCFFSSAIYKKGTKKESETSNKLEIIMKNSLLLNKKTTYLNGTQSIYQLKQKLLSTEPMHNELGNQPKLCLEHKPHFMKFPKKHLLDIRSFLKNHPYKTLVVLTVKQRRKKDNTLGRKGSRNFSQTILCWCYVLHDEWINQNIFSLGAVVRIMWGIFLGRAIWLQDLMQFFLESEKRDLTEKLFNKKMEKNLGRG